MVAAQAPKPVAAPAAPTQDYLVAVAAEAVDKIQVVRFGPKGIAIEKEIGIGYSVTDPDGPHGIAFTPDRQHYYVSTAHGTPFGYLWKYKAANDSLIGTVMLGNFPATLQVTPDGWYAYVVNFNLHGEMKPSSVSVVAIDDMVEVARIPTCTMPHGSRINAAGTKQYSACMMDDMLVEIDTRQMGVSRHFKLTKGNEHGEAGSPNHGAKGGAHGGAHAGHDAGGHGMEAPKAGDVSCSPTWAQPSVDGRRVFVACNKSSDVVEVDADSWKMVRRIPTGEGVYNLAVTHDGTRLLATNKRGQSVSIIDLKTGRETARVATSRKVVHGVVVSPDDRYAFVTVEGIGSQPGTVEVIDLATNTRVAAVDVGQQVGGIDFYKVVGGK